MEGFLHIRIRPWLRRMITRSLAVVPAVVLISGSGGRDTVALLVFSQVVLSMQLPFAIFPLMRFTSDPALMGEFVNGRWTKLAGYTTSVLIAVLNAALLWQAIGTAWSLAVVGVALGFAIWVRFVYRGDRGCTRRSW